ncbi:MAG: HNH endonuclease [Prevotellaceae bacterium]|nr:HNH endonuclease [Prevotellaceae bacterium]
MEKLGRLIENTSELMDNLLQVDTYLSGDNEEDYNAMIGLIRRGTDFVVYKSAGKIHFAPSRFVGYLSNRLIVHLVKRNGKNGTKTTPAINKILGCNCAYDEILEKDYLKFCHELQVVLKHMVKTQRKYWLLDNKQNKIYTEEYYEGSLQQALVNRYERNPIARKKCIEKYGCICQVCEMDFGKVYGELGNGFIHVHHIVPISARKGEQHRIDPENNLVPVCPNCHAMLHKGKLSIEKLRKILGK